VAVTVSAETVTGNADLLSRERVAGVHVAAAASDRRAAQIESITARVSSDVSPNPASANARSWA